MVKQLSLRGITLLCLVFLVVLTAFLVFLDPALRYRWRHDGPSLDHVLYSQVRTEDAPERIQRLLGPGAAGDRDSALRAFQTLSSRYPDLYPEGAEAGDTFLWYPSGDGASIVLQFRDGKLVNHNPEDFREFQRMMLIR